MKRFYIAIVSVSVIFFLVPAVLSAPPRPCKPGDTWKNDCNTCFCTTGKVAACTKMACLPRKTRATIRECEPFTTWNDGCNDCRCTENGHPACTEMFCLDTRPIERCVSGTSWKLDCNSCVCRNGSPICTQRACPPVDK